MYFLLQTDYFVGLFDEANYLALCHYSSIHKVLGHPITLTHSLALVNTLYWRQAVG